MQVFDPERDLLGGTMSHAASAQIIEQRCKKLVPVLSASFFQRAQNQYLLDLAGFVSMDQRRRMVIPVLYTNERLSLPVDVRRVTKVPYVHGDDRINFYERLLNSLGVADVDDGLKQYRDEFKLEVGPQPVAAAAAAAAAAPAPMRLRYERWRCQFRTVVTLHLC